MKRTAIALIMALLFLEVTGTHLVNCGMANPISGEQWGGRYIPPPNGMKLPVISISSPKNNTLSTSNSISLSFDVSPAEWENKSAYEDYQWLALNVIGYKADWQREVFVFSASAQEKSIVEATGKFPYNTTLKEVPEGTHTITVFANAWFNSGCSTTVTFTVDSVPSISFLSYENKTFENSFRLNFTVNQPVSETTYSLDGQNNITISGNTTLSGLANGYHNLTVYAKDEDGNIGASETMYFTVEVLFPTVLVTVVSGASLAAAGIGLLVYLKKRKHVDAKQVK